MKASDLTEWIGLFLPDLQPDGQGGFVETIPASVEQDFPAHVEVSSAGEEFQQQGEKDSVVYTITIRFEPGITTAWRVSWLELYLDVTEATNVDMRSVWLELRCRRKGGGTQ